MLVYYGYIYRDSEFFWYESIILAVTERSAFYLFLEQRQTLVYLDNAMSFIWQLTLFLYVKSGSTNFILSHNEDYHVIFWTGIAIKSIYAQ